MSVSEAARLLNRNIFTLAQGSALGILATVAAAPLVSRLYTPSQMGETAIFIAIVSICTVFFSGRLEMALPQIVEERDAIDFGWLCLSIGGLATVAFTGIALGLQPLYARWVSHAALGSLGPEFFTALLSAGIAQIGNYLGVRFGLFGQLRVSRVVQAASLGGLQAALGYAGWGVPGLIWGITLSNLLSVLPLLAPLARRGFFSLGWVQSANLARAWAHARTHRRFTFYVTWASLADILGLHVPAFALAMVSGTAATGAYSLCMRVLGLPVLVAGQAVSSAFYHALVGKSDADRRALCGQTADSLFRLGLWGFGLIMAGGPEIFAWVFGEPWRLAGIYSQWLAPSILLLFVGSPLSIATAFRDQHVVFWLALMTVTVKAVGIYIGARWGSSDGAVVGLAVAACLASAIYLTAVLRVGGIAPGRWALQTLWHRRLEWALLALAFVVFKGF